MQKHTATPPTLIMCSLGTFNAEGKFFGNKLDFINCMNKLVLDVMCIQDTGTRKPSHTSNPFQYHDIMPHYSPPTLNDKAGRLVILIKDTIMNISTVTNVTNRHQSLSIPSPINLTIHNVYRKASDKASAEYIAALSITPTTIIAGDLNCWANPALDMCTTSKLWSNSQPITQLIKRGMIDPFRELYPTKFAYTRWGTHIKKSGITVTTLSRIDYILTHKSLADKITDYIIIQDQEINSDHRLGILKLDVNGVLNCPPPLPITVRKNIKDKTLWKEKFPAAVLLVDNLQNINTLASSIKDTLIKALDETFSAQLTHPNQAKKHALTSPVILSLKTAKKSAYRIQRTILVHLRHGRTANSTKLMSATHSLRSHSPETTPDFSFTESDLSKARSIENRLCTLIGREI